MNIYQKISEVMKSIEYLTKDNKVEFGSTKYKAISEEKVTSAVRKELINQGIVIIPITQECTVTELIRTEKSVNQRADVHTKYRIQNIDDVNDFIEVESNGSGVDTQDKAVGKAMTYAYKYMLLRTFAIPTGEDPDKISSAETDYKMQNEIESQKIISEKLRKGLDSAIENNNIDDDTVFNILNKYGYTSTTEIKMKDYMKIVNDLKSKKE
jgi:hypothetical protein